MLIVRLTAALAFGFAVCLAATHLTDGLDANPGSSWIMCAMFAGLAALGMGHARARHERNAAIEHLGLCAGAVLASVVATRHAMPPVTVALVTFVFGRIGHMYSRVSLDE